MTAVGLCFGGGQIGLGTVLLALGVGVLWGLKKVELALPQEYRATFSILLRSDGRTETDLKMLVQRAGYHISTFGVYFDRAAATRELQMELSWTARPSQIGPPGLVDELAGQQDVQRLRWSPHGQAGTENGKT